MLQSKILWLVSWYPSKLALFNGDFIKRHAEAVSLYHDIQVIYVIRDVEGLVTDDILIDESINGTLAETIIYYYSKPVGIPIIDKYRSEKKYRTLFKAAIERYIKKSGTPVLSHVHVGMKAGVIALWLKKVYSIPFAITEHWSGFLHEADEKISDQPFYIRSLWNRVIAGAVACSAVSQYLADSMKKYSSFVQVTVIPNVVNTSAFYPATASANNLRFIHISGLEELKNVKGIIEAFAIVQRTYPASILDIIGPGNKKLEILVRELQLDNSVHFHSEIPQEQLAAFVQKALALILYSRYETFGCVVIEANACGVPVIVSDIPVFHETVSEGVNGFFAEANNPAALADKMMRVVNLNQLIDGKIITETANKYTYQKVGKQFSDWYNEILTIG